MIKSIQPEVREIKRYVALRLRHWNRYELLGQRSSSLNWETIMIFDDIKDTRDYAIKLSHREEIPVYDLNGRSLKEGWNYGTL